jgi:hypothetical protein
MHEQEGLNLTPTQQSMVALWEQHIAAEFQKHDVKATLPTVTNSTISGNEGRGVNAFPESDFSLINTTATRNGGGGVHLFNGATVTLTRSVIAGNTGHPGGAEVFNNNGSITAASFNLFGYRGLTNGQAFENFTPGPTDITATSNGNDPTALVNILNPTLANNGGPIRPMPWWAGARQ